MELTKQFSKTLAELSLSMEEGFEVANACVKVADNHAIAFMFWYRDVQHKYPDNHDGAFLLDEYNRYLVDMEYLEKINTSGNE